MNSQPKLLAAALAATSSLAFGQSYTVGPVVSTGSTTTSVAIGDLNRDGAPDMVATTGWNDSVTIALGTKAAAPIVGRVQRQFGTPTTLAIGGSYPRDVTLVDLDGDKLLDLVTANRDSDDLSVLLGNGLGGFGAPTTVAVGMAPHSLLVQDFNNDNVPDVAVSCSASGEVYLLLGNGGGGFASTNAYAVAGTPEGMTFGDFDADGRMDVAVAGVTSDSVDVLLNVGGGFATPVTVNAPRPSDVCCEDFNGDGNLDLVTADARGQISVLAGNGAGGFATPPANYGTLNGGWSQHLACCDLDLDGDVDIVVVGGNDVVSVLANNYDRATNAIRFGRATLIPAGAGASATRVRIADVDTDGNYDIVVASEHSWDGRVLYSDAPLASVDIVGFPAAPYDNGYQGTPGCGGYLGTRSTVALVGQPFVFEVTNAPADATGLFLLGGPPSQVGIPPYTALGINVHIGPGLISTVLMNSNLAGTGLAETTIPMMPPLAGAQFFLQSAWIEKEGVSQCSRSSLGAVTSRILDVTIR